MGHHNPSRLLVYGDLISQMAGNCLTDRSLL